ncbi:PIG-L family deacetylase [Candidatus Microgenomates bacterium]|nr:PIG-L family deacetylase [Candidatus Microgenomates bacterium]
MKTTNTSNAFIKELTKQYTHAVCFSPHLDDAVFSAGGLLSELSKHMPIEVVNVFTSPGEAKSTLSAKQFLKQCAIPSPKLLFDVRLNEDKHSLSLINAEVIDMNYTDALWRTHTKSLFPRRFAGKLVPELTALYPTYRYHIIKGQVHPQDKDLMIELARKFRNIAPDPTKIAVFAPVGVGGHVDHRIVRDACRLAFGKHAYYWLDFPYFAMSGTTNNFITYYSLKPHTVSIQTNKKKLLCEKYSSQYDIVIKDKAILESPEQFFHS